LKQRNLLRETKLTKDSNRILACMIHYLVISLPDYTGCMKYKVHVTNMPLSEVIFRSKRCSQ